MKREYRCIAPPVAAVATTPPAAVVVLPPTFVSATIRGRFPSSASRVPSGATTALARRPPHRLPSPTAAPRHCNERRWSARRRTAHAENFPKAPRAAPPAPPPALCSRAAVAAMQARGVCARGSAASRYGAACMYTRRPCANESPLPIRRGNRPASQAHPATHPPFSPRLPCRPARLNMRGETVSVSDPITTGDCSGRPAASMPVA